MNAIVYTLNDERVEMGWYYNTDSSTGSPLPLHTWLHALRRATLADTPTLAVDWVQIISNTTAIPDAQIFLRMQELPVLCHTPSLLWREDILPTHETCPQCSASQREAQRAREEAGTTQHTDSVLHYCWKCSIPVVLRATCPEDQDRRLVTSADADILHPSSSSLLNPNDPLSMHVSILPGCELFELRSHQELEIICFLTKATGRKHIRWQPAATVVPRPMFSVTVRDTLSGSMPPRIDQTGKGDSIEPTLRVGLRDSCPHGVFEILHDGTIDATNERACTACGACQAYLNQQTNAGSSLQVMVKENPADLVLYTIEVGKKLGLTCS